MKVCPAIVIVPCLAGPVLAATVNCTVPFPFPFAPEVTIIQDAPLLTVQLQPVEVATFTLPFVPIAGMLLKADDDKL